MSSYRRISLTDKNRLCCIEATTQFVLVSDSYVTTNSTSNHSHGAI